MNAIDVPRKIKLIPDLMLPIAPLPDASLTLGLAAGTSVLAFCQLLRESGLDGSEHAAVQLWISCCTFTQINLAGFSCASILLV